MRRKAFESRDANYLRDVVAGMDESQMDESLWEAQWESVGEAEYHPFAKPAIALD